LRGRSSLSRELPLTFRRNISQQIIGNLDKRVTRFSRSTHLSYFSYTLFVALFEPRDVEHALSDSSWVNAMHEELENFKRNQVWTLVDPPRDVNIIGTKWVLKKIGGGW
jgi:GTP1/Obg family GTP-binding protein